MLLLLPLMVLVLLLVFRPGAAPVPVGGDSVRFDWNRGRAVVTVSPDQQSLAIGRGGQNVRLAAKLTGWKIDIVSTGGDKDAPADEEVPAEAEEFEEKE